jgi:hypothetical protein
VNATDRISAQRVIAARPESVFAFLADLDNHRLIADRYLDVVRLDGAPGARHGGQLRLRGPFGLRRAARTRVLLRQAPYLMVGRAEVGRRTVAQVSWTLQPRGEVTEVELVTAVTPRGVVDRMLLAAGGRLWLRWRMGAALTALAVLLASDDTGTGQGSC